MLMCLYIYWYCWPFWIYSLINNMHLVMIDSGTKLSRKMPDFVVGTMPADDRASFGARISASILMIELVSYEILGPGPCFTNGFSIAIQMWWKFHFTFHLDSNTVNTTKFCTWHDSCAVVACAIISCDLMACNENTARQSFHRIWIGGQKSLVKRAPQALFQYEDSLSRYEDFHYKEQDGCDRVLSL